MLKARYFLLVFLLSVFVRAGAQSNLDTAFNFVVKDLYGNNIELFQLLDQGKFVVMDFFSPACGFCQLYAGEMQEAYLAHGENQDNIFFMGVGWGASIQNLFDFMAEYGLTYPMVSGSQGGGNQLLTDYQIVSYPSIILIKPDRAISGELYIPYHPPTAAKIDSILQAAGAIFTGLKPERDDSRSVPVASPNPATDFVNLSFSLEKQAAILLEIKDLQGRSILKHHAGVFPSGPSTYILQLPNLKTGIYALQITTENQKVFTVKLIIN